MKNIIKNNIERFDNYIEKADNKASFILAFNGAIILAILFQSHEVLKTNDNLILKNVMMIGLILLTISTITSIILSILVIIPKMKISKNKSLMCFQDVSSYSLDEYKNCISNLENEKNIVKELINESKQLSEICSSKMNKIKYSIIALCFSIAIITMLIVFIIIQS